MIALPSFREMSFGLYGAWRLARWDTGAMAWFDATPEGASRSFWTALLCFPGFIALLALRVSEAEWARSGVGHILLVESIGYVFGWVAFPLVALYFCRWLGREDRGFAFVTAYNWFQLVETGLFVFVAALAAARLLPSGTTDAISATALIAVLVYEWFVARIAIGAGGVAAAALVLADLVLGAAVNQVTQGLY
jgi:hypothetical protein